MLKIKSSEVRRRTDGKYNGSGSRMRIYVSVDRESILENLMMRRSRPAALYKEVLPEFFAKHATELHINTEDIPKIVKATTWSQRAGCGCGCSPGFVVNGGWIYGREAWITVEKELQAQTKMGARDLEFVTDRMNQVKADPTLTALFKETPRYFGEEA
jgi:hypothetical protein